MSNTSRMLSVTVTADRPVARLTAWRPGHRYYLCRGPRQSIGLAPVFRRNCASRTKLKRSGRLRQPSASRETPMNVAKWLLLALLALPIMELAAFIAVAEAIGFLWALLLMVATSMAGAMVLRHAGGNHIARVRVAMAEGGFTALQADSAGTLTLLAGILLLIPGFITDVLGLLLLLAPLRRALGVLLGLKPAPARADGVVDLAPEQWHQVPDAALTDRRDNQREHQ